MPDAQSDQTRLCLIAAAEEGGAWRARVGAALDATRAATLILTAPDGVAAIDPAAARPLVELAQAKGIAALIANDAATARAAGADGVHLCWRPEIEDAYAAARAALGPAAIVGADAGASRHDAMTLGDGGADYVAFDRMADALGPDAARDTQRELVAWWSEVFVVPVVAFGVETPADVAELVRRGADFVAVRLPRAASGPDADAAWASALVAALHSPADAA